MKIFITGATGFVGINVVNALKQNHELVLLVRNPERAGSLFGDECEYVIGDVRNSDALAKGLEKADAVIHIAGLIKSFNPDELYETNRLGTRKLAERIADTNIENIIYVSSLAARGPDGVDHPVSHYGYSKRLGEYELVNICFDRNPKILRPTIIYGPYERYFFKLFEMAERGFFPILKHVLFSYVHVFDVVEAIVRLLDFKARRVSVYTISDGDCYTMDELADLICKVMGKNRLMRMPLTASVARLITVLGYPLGEKLPFSFDKTREMDVDGWCCDFAALREDVDFEPKYNLKRGLEETYGWYKEHGWL